MALNDPSRDRSGERGAALFVVVLAITLLTAIGVFAAHVTSFAQVASGYVRRSASAMGIAEFALSSVTGDMSGKEGDYDRSATRTDPPSTCRMNRGLPAGVPISCHVVDAQGASYFMPVDAKTGGMLGSLSRDQSVEGAFRVEITDVQQSAGLTPGMGSSGNAVSLRQREAMVTVTGSLLPTPDDPTKPSQCVPDRTRASENVSVRAFISYTVP